MIRVLVADDHPIVRSGIVALLGAADDFDVVGEAANGAEAVDQALLLRPDLVVMDLRMPVMEGGEATGRILAVDSGIRVVLLTTYDTDEAILPAIEQGASGYLLKAAPEAEILAGLRSVARGEVALAPSIAASLVRRVAQGRGPASTGGSGDGAGAGEAATRGVTLTDRERQVLRLVANGSTNRKTADALFVSEATVKTHLLHIFEKLDVRDRTRAVTRAMELGLLESPGEA
ncbi:MULTISPECIES: response regulator transcription factor [unclassified Frondihabitans]|uniref:response regulator n=1 Tax=unclassified Frondihabitans TaxID=2626248 RepID=UPI000F50C558|nr:MULTISPECIES: response regulator transcription factor [unclassified Frondihabitans]RPE78159.1 LuxR family two component transcriptional regulator [Frondihabitans sp. PhB153]RPF08440.1 LuxR family two component transcriptional regulator [Frondihabitans sp. PhB161]